jgi:serine/threonine-protein kinase
MKLESLAEVARGGMGSVELSRVVDGARAGQVLAVKRLHANIAEDPEFVAMFLDEAWITGALKHANVAQVIAWGNDEHGTYLAIELVMGVSLSRLLKEAQTNQEPFAERTVAYICSQLLGGLTAAHSLTAPDGSPLGVVHRDLTPANVLVSFDGDVKIIDFGIAKAEERITHTRTGQLKGKPSYMAPEQQRGASVDHRADLFSFGVLMFELLAGRRPWTSKGAFDVMMEIANDPHPDLGELRRGLNPEFVAIAHRCLEKKPEARFQHAAEIKARLDAWLEAKGFSADDKQSLANFVQRNSQPQMKWWEEALRGEHNKKKAPTFKELEEKIDEEREKQRKAAARAQPPPRPAAGGTPPPIGPRAGAPGRLSGTQPMAAYPALAARYGDAGPHSSAVPPPSSGPHSSGPMSPLPQSAAPMSPLPQSAPPVSAPQRTSYLGPPVSYQPAASEPPMSPHPVSMGPQAAPNPGAPSSHPASTPQFNGGGTEYMAVSPLAGIPLPLGPAGPPPVPRVPDPQSGAFPSSQRWSQPSPQPQPSAIMPQPQPALDPTVPLAPGLRVGTSTMPSGGVPVAPPKKSRALLWVLLITVPLAGIGLAGWIFRDQILNLAGGGGTESPAPRPAPKR